MIILSWDYLYGLLGIRDFIYFISSPSIQDTLWPVKIVFIAFTIFFLCAIIWFYLNSSYLQYEFLQDTTEFLSHETYGLRRVTQSWRKIRRRAESGREADLKLAIIDADDFLFESLQDADYSGNTFEELLESASSKVSNAQEVLDAHAVRNAIVYEPDYLLDADTANRLLSVYETAGKNISIN